MLARKDNQLTLFIDKLVTQYWHCDALQMVDDLINGLAFRDCQWNTTTRTFLKSGPIEHNGDYSPLSVEGEFVALVSYPAATTNGVGTRLSWRISHASAPIKKGISARTDIRHLCRFPLVSSRDFS